jgi:hypothetical protein
MSRVAGSGVSKRTRKKKRTVMREREREREGERVREGGPAIGREMSQKHKST